MMMTEMMKMQRLGAAGGFPAGRDSTVDDVSHLEVDESALGLRLLILH